MKMLAGCPHTFAGGSPAGEEVTGFGDYGYLWQIDRPGSRRYAGLHLAAPFYIASGGKGHAAFMMPALDLVIVHQVATLGGTSPEAQMKRMREGSPEVNDQQMEELLAAIIRAHRKPPEAFGVE